MGTLVKSASRADTKPNYTIATVAFGSVAVADGEMGVFVGANVAPQVSNYTGTLDKCTAALRDAGWPNPTTGTNAQSYYDVVAQAFTDTLSENCVAVIKGFDYTPQGVSNTAHARRMTELWLEDVAKVS